MISGIKSRTSLPMYAAPLRFTARVEFYRAEPTAVTSWLMAVLMGANSRTYKFALGGALLDFARDGRTEFSMSELALPYARRLVERAQSYPQAPTASMSGTTDFLTVVKDETAASLRGGAPTPRLVDAAVASMPQMVMRKFHNLRQVGEVAHRFYELVGRGHSRGV